MGSLEIAEFHLVHFSYVRRVHIAEAIEFAIIEEGEWRLGEGKVIHCILMVFSPLPLFPLTSLEEGCQIGLHLCPSLDQSCSFGCV